ncbi:MAG: glycine--tRNA ligase subunit beta [Rhodobacterales bacterium]
MPDLLLELFSEEIPARMQKRAAEDLRALVTNGLVEAGITYESAAAFATPRRLCLTVTGVLDRSPGLREERKGPRTDAPVQAVDGFLRATGLTRDQLEVRDEKKGQLFFAVIDKPGRAASDVVAEVVTATIRNFPWPKSMRWGSGSLRWVRPLQSILCILTDQAGVETVPVVVDHLVAADSTEGHRFMAPARFKVTSFDDYVLRLKRAFVVLDASERADHIWADATTQAFALGLEVVEDKGLLAEVSGLVEWPVVLMGDIAADFLDLPPEVLQTSMREHQKFFSVRNPASGRIEKFVTVANRETADDGMTILAGNQKVLFARLSDAKFFWENDLRTIAAVGMDGMAAGLANVTFHNKLGSQAERVARIAALAAEIAPFVGAKPDMAAEAARIAKADLQSEMVGEFPELQGLMGMYYARAAGYDDTVAAACSAHYSPLGPSDSVPTEPVSVAVALADKIDTLSGFWAVDEKPTGSKDPFALRRAGLGVIRLVLGNGIRLNLTNLINQGQATLFSQMQTSRLHGLTDLLAGIPQVPDDLKEEAIIRAEGRIVPDAEDGSPNLGRYEETARQNAVDLINFLHDRLKVHLKDQGIRHDVIDACLAMPGNDDLVLLVNRATALNTFVTSDDGTNLLQGYKRAINILTAEEKKDGVSYEGAPEERFAEDATETALFAALDVADAAIAPAIKSEDFALAMGVLAALRAPIDGFFTAVQINSTNQIVRRNRLCLLNRIREVMAKTARFDLLDG